MRSFAEIGSAETFTLVHDWVLATKRVNARQAILFGLIIRRGKIRESQQEMADNLNCHRQTIIRDTHHMEKIGLIVARRRIGRQCKNEYVPGPLYLAALSDIGRRTMLHPIVEKDFDLMTVVVESAQAREKQKPTQVNTNRDGSAPTAPEVAWTDGERVLLAAGIHAADVCALAAGHTPDDLRALHAKAIDKARDVPAYLRALLKRGVRADTPHKRAETPQPPADASWLKAPKPPTMPVVPPPPAAPVVLPPPLPPPTASEPGELTADEIRDYMAGKHHHRAPTTAPSKPAYVNTYQPRPKNANPPRPKTDTSKLRAKVATPPPRMTPEAELAHIAAAIARHSPGPT